MINSAKGTLPAEPVNLNHPRLWRRSQAYPLKELGPPGLMSVPLWSILQLSVRLVAVWQSEYMDVVETAGTLVIVSVGEFFGGVDAKSEQKNC